MNNKRITEAYLQWKEDDGIIRGALRSLDQTRSEVRSEFEAVLTEETGIQNPFVESDCVCDESPLGLCIINAHEWPWVCKLCGNDIPDDF